LPRHVLGVAITIVLPVLLPVLMRRIRGDRDKVLSETGWSGG
jgi:hypothetical protein